MSDKLGFTFYPKDWWASDTYFELNAIQRYIYLECLFLMYSNNGYLKTQKTQLENRLRIPIETQDWDIIKAKFNHTEFGFTHSSINKRLKKTLANRENGKKGGRPKKTQETQIKTQINPPLERERESEEEREIINTNINNSGFSKICLSETQWCEIVCMQNKIQETELKDVVSEFEKHLITIGEQKSNLSEFKRHFSNWVVKQPQKASSTDVKTTNQLQPHYDDD